jgi:hypothetical protein
MAKNTELTVAYQLTASLSPHPQNPRRHSDTQLEQLWASYSRFGWTVPLIVDEDGTILAGHGRWEMAMRNSIGEVPTIIKAGLTAEEKRAYLIADNKLSANSDWDIPLLMAEIEFLSAANIEPDTLGFTDADLLGYQSMIDDVMMPPAELAPEQASFRGRPRTIESSTEPTQLQEDDSSYERPQETPGGPSYETAANLVPFSVMMPADDRERLFAAINAVKEIEGEQTTTAEALVTIIAAFENSNGGDHVEAEAE